MKRSLLFAFLLPCSFSLVAQTNAADTVKTAKVLRAERITSAPKIDGMLDDEAWKNAPIATDFIQDEPDYGKPSEQRTEVKIIYDNTAIYIGAFMYDTRPDSILHELGMRDQDNLNADYFLVGFDTYSKNIDAYIFGVSASGVQLDFRVQTNLYDAVWHSAVKINDKGWCAEFKIPYSALRFPDQKVQSWGLEFERSIRRNRERSRWTFIPKNSGAFLKYFGRLEGVSDIQPPLRLSLTPYLSSYYEIAPSFASDGTYSYHNSFSYNAGADIKWGLNESFTLDMTLLPDFGQVQSDNKVKNLSPFETFYEEYRPFFKEGTELFNRGMFYTRRIGRTPARYYEVPDLLNPGETIESNPAQAKLLNATKLSGRTNNGTGIGLFNAVTDYTYAVVKDSAGRSRKILTEPFTNYNAVVVDQQLKNSSNVYFMNTNVMRDGNAYRDANVTNASFTLQNKKNSWEVNGGATLSQLFMRNDSMPDNFENQLGYSYYGGAAKISGTWQYGIGSEALSSKFDRNDMGYLGSRNFATTRLYGGYHLSEPKGPVMQSNTNINLFYSLNYTTKLTTNISGDLNSWTLFKSYASVWGGFGTNPVPCYDYYEPRQEGRYSFKVEGYWAWAGFSTDYRKTLALDASANISAFSKHNVYGLDNPLSGGIELKPRVRVNDKLSFIYLFNIFYDPNNFGFASNDSAGNIIFGERELYTWTNMLTAKYIFKNDLSFSLNARHYWNRGDYLRYYTLLENGDLENNTAYASNNNFSYNAFNIDAVFSWQFAPGSLLSVVYKNAIEKEENIILPHFGDNLSRTLKSPQTNSLSLKVIYYLDYQYLKKNR